jgi:hypothetical protein
MLGQNRPHMTNMGGKTIINIVASIYTVLEMACNLFSMLKILTFNLQYS